VTSWLVPSAGQKIPVQPGCRRSGLLKTVFFRQVRELKMQRKIHAVLYGVLNAPFIIYG